MRKLRISVVYYLNSLPLAWGFIRGRQRGRFDLVFSPPSQCSTLLAASSVDVGLIPVIEYQRIPDLQVVPGLSLAAKHKVRSVLLVSKPPVSRVRTIAVDDSSRTSVCLLQILLRDRFGIQPDMRSVPPDLKAMLETCDAALVIGDIALRARNDGLFVYDLAAEWRSLTGLPFVFAFWSVRKSCGLQNAFAFEDSFQEGYEHLADIAREQARKLDLPETSLLSYLSDNMNYHLDAENLEGLQLFYQLARQHRLVSTVKKLEFLS
jgi:chorismate dehydratase